MIPVFCPITLTGMTGCCCIMQSELMFPTSLTITMVGNYIKKTFGYENKSV